MTIEYRIVDVETTGLKVPEPPASGVADVGWITINPDTLEVISDGFHLCDPGCPMEEGASAINGLTDEMLAGKPRLEEVYHVPHAVITIGHNEQFDGLFLATRYDNLVGRYCTLAGARTYYRTSPNHKLQTLADHLGLKRGEAHRALGDCYTTLALLRHIVATSGRSLEQLVKAAAKPKVVHVMPFGMHKGTPLSDLPLHYLRYFDDKDVDPDLRYSIDQQYKVRGV